MAAPPEQSKPLSVAKTVGFFRTLGLFQGIPEASERKDFHSDLIRSLLKVDRVELGRIVCTLTVKSSVTVIPSNPQISKLHELNPILH
ncbi:hypothetical protein AXF42_Ash013995 [Apostasia shenzhenica]|uniref:Uncharacterized protein n=1 Tax=Apostasia shenzhenica TaxID=1088818 RepID=A0A2I0A951_9ASPA|nr:hypothetical protein AXF42_Ash013995 [Apostasia shenzhenica]